MRYYYPLSSALLSAFALLSPTTESFAPRSLTSATPRPTETSLFVSVSPDSLDGTLPQKTSVAAVPKVAQRWRKSTKQLATLGPASSNYEMIEKVSICCSADVLQRKSEERMKLESLDGVADTLLHDFFVYSCF